MGGGSSAGYPGNNPGYGWVGLMRRFSDDDGVAFSEKVGSRFAKTAGWLVAMAEAPVPDGGGCWRGISGHGAGGGALWRSGLCC